LIQVNDWRRIGELSNGRVRRRQYCCAAAAPGHPEVSMPTRLLRLVLPLLLPVLFLGNAAAMDREQKVALDPAVAVNGYAALVGQNFAQIRNGLRILAAGENAASGDWNRIRGPLAVLAKGTPASAAVWFARPDGSYFAVAGGRTGQNLKNRDYFPKLMAGQEVAGDLVVSKSTGSRSAIVAVPVTVRGRVIGALGVSVAMEKVAALVEDEFRFPPDVMFYALDASGQIALHRESKLLFEFATELGSPTLNNAVKEMLAKPEGIVHYEFDGAQRTAIFKRSQSTGWTFALRW
jgi:cache domain-containing protein